MEIVSASHMRYLVNQVFIINLNCANILYFSDNTIQTIARV